MSNLPDDVIEDRRAKEPMWKVFVGPTITLLIAGIGMAASWGNISARMNALEDKQRLAEIAQKELRAEILIDIKDIKRDVQTILVETARQNPAPNHRSNYQER